MMNGEKFQQQQQQQQQQEEEEEEEEVGGMAMVEQVMCLYEKICELESLEPCEAVNSLFSQLVDLCIRPCHIDVEAMEVGEEEMAAKRSHLIHLCAIAEGLLESHYAKLLAAMEKPLENLHVFPYYSNYRDLAAMEYEMLRKAQAQMDMEMDMDMDKDMDMDMERVAFVGSGPLPMTSLVLATYHMKRARFDNYDIDPRANDIAARLSSSLTGARMAFHTCDIRHVREELADYRVLFLAALVGVDAPTKADILAHLARFMHPRATLVVRSAHGSRAFLYPAVPVPMLESAGFRVLSVFHPSDEVVNSIIIARLRSSPPVSSSISTPSTTSTSSSDPEDEEEEDEDEDEDEDDDDDDDNDDDEEEEQDQCPKWRTKGDFP